LIIINCIKKRIFALSRVKQLPYVEPSA